MEPNKFAKQMVSYQRILFDNTYNAATVVQDNTENLINACLKQFPWLTEEARKPFNDSFTFMKSAREDYKKTVDQGFDNFEEFIDKK
jgi:hypothetical protein